MKQDEIIEMARQAGFGLRYEGRGQISSAPTTTEKLEAFAKLVAAKERKEWAKEFAGLGEWTAVHILEARNET